MVFQAKYDLKTARLRMRGGQSRVGFGEAASCSLGNLLCCVFNLATRRKGCFLVDEILASLEAVKPTGSGKWKPKLPRRVLYKFLS